MEAVGDMSSVFLVRVPGPASPLSQRTQRLLCQYAGGHLAGHCRDEGGPAAAPLLRLDEGDLAVRSEIPDDFMEPVTETELGGKQGV